MKIETLCSNDASTNSFIRSVITTPAILCTQLVVILMQNIQTHEDTCICVDNIRIAVMGMIHPE